MNECGVFPARVSAARRSGDRCGAQPRIRTVLMIGKKAVGVPAFAREAPEPRCGIQPGRIEGEGTEDGAFYIVAVAGRPVAPAIRRQPGIKDLVLISAAREVEHYEIAGYASVRNLAETLRQAEAVELLQQTLDEEGKTDKDLTSIALELQTDALYLRFADSAV